nr:MAG TPA: hypothetical protein [Caudoviricetes sp.]
MALIKKRRVAPLCWKRGEDKEMIISAWKIKALLVFLFW